MSGHADRLNVIREETAKEHNLPIDNHLVGLIASLRMSGELLQIRLVDETLTVNELTSLNTSLMQNAERLAEVKALAPGKIEVGVCIVETLHGVCQKCGHMQDTGRPLDEPAPEPARISPPQRQLTGPAPKPAAAASKPTKAIDGQIIPPPKPTRRALSGDDAVWAGLAGMSGGGVPTDPDELAARGIAPAIDHSKSVHYCGPGDEPWRQNYDPGFRRFDNKR